MNFMKMEHNFKIKKMKDLFETPELIPQNVMDILNTFEDNTYNECLRVQYELECIGYTFDFYLDAEPYNLRELELELI